MDALMINGKIVWPNAQFAYKADPRFSFCMHIPAHLRSDRAGAKLVVVVHGTGRSCMAYRDALAAFADANGYVVLAPLFPVGVLGDDNADGYKYIAEGGIRYDHVLLGMIAQLENLLEHQFGRFSLFGFSGGGHFAHRFFYLQPKSLRSVSVGAPGGMTLLDDTRNFWIGTGDFEARYGQRIDMAALREVRAQLLVGAEDLEEFVYPAGRANHVDGMELLGRNRVERNATLMRNWQEQGLDVEQTIISGIAHEGLKMFPALEDFLIRL
jgi:pimeloyl-ACP methyl ester carboxylesterase